MDRVAHYECEGWGFESLQAHHKLSENVEISIVFGYFIVIDSYGEIQVDTGALVVVKYLEQGITASQSENYCSSIHFKNLHGGQTYENKRL